MTFGQLQTAVYQVCGYPTPVQPIVVSRVKNWLNEAHRHCLRLPGLVELRQRSGIPFMTVEGQAIYKFPQAFERIDAVVERTTHRRLRAISRDIFRSIDPAETSLGTPTCYAPEGWQCRFALPVGATPLTMAPPGTPPTVANTGSGVYPATLRYYRIAWRVLVGTLVTQQSPLGPVVAFTPSGVGMGVRITKPAASTQGETEWVICASADDVAYYAISRNPVSTPFFDDVADPSSYGNYQQVNFPSSPIWAVSTNLADLTQMIRLHGIRANGDLQIRVEVGPLNGVTRVQLGGITDYIDLVSLTLSSACFGDVSFYDGAIGGHELARIPAGQTSAQYWCLRLWPTPSSAVLYYVDGQIEIPELVHETDVPMLPPSYHDVLAAFARMREYERTGDSRFAVAAQEWGGGVAQLRAFVNYPDDWKPVAGSMASGDLGRTNLPGWFPADGGWP